MSPEIAQFSPALFWDVAREKADVRTNKGWLIARVLGYGRFSDWKALRALYSLDDIVATAQSLRSLDAKSLAFLCVVGQVPKDHSDVTPRSSRTRHHGTPEAT